MNVYKLIFKKLKKKIVDNSKMNNTEFTSYPQKKYNCNYMKMNKLKTKYGSYDHMHSPY